MADKEVSQNLAFTFLQDCRKSFFEVYSHRDIENATAYGLKTFGSEYLKPKMQLYNDNPGMVKDKTDELLKNMLDLKENMVENIENLIQRDGKIEIIAEKAMQLSSVSNSYKKRSKKVKEVQRRRRYCYVAALIVVVLICAGFIAYAIWGGTSSSSSDKKE